MWSLFCRLAKMQGCKLSWKYLNIVSLAGTATGSYADRIDISAQGEPPIPTQLLLILKNTLELAKNAISKSLIIFKVFLKKVLEFLLYHWIVSLEAILLMPLLNHCSAKKRSSKWDLIWPIGPVSFKIILILLAKIIAI